MENLFDHIIMKALDKENEKRYIYPKKIQIHHWKGMMT